MRWRSDARIPAIYTRRSLEAMAEHVNAMLALKRMGSVTFDYGNNLRAQAQRGGAHGCVRNFRFVPEYIRPLFCEGRGPFRWAALSGSPADIHSTDRLALELFPHNPVPGTMDAPGPRAHPVPGLAGPICWLGYGERAEFGLAMNDYVRRGKIEAPIVIGRDHLDAGSVASPYRETEAMLDGSTRSQTGRC